ncbi:conserved hypothetical protein [delta proteobacterium NaphS2]|nr:conserved hypothetical protein [delta proteobacterium NaphS2]
MFKETEVSPFSNLFQFFQPVPCIFLLCAENFGTENEIFPDYLNKPIGTSPEKVELHYYCVMLARMTIDYFRSILCCREWQSPEDWKCVLSTIRTSMFSNQNCELSRDDSGDLLLTFLDGDRYGVKKQLAKRMEQRKNAGLNRVSWWGGIGVQIEVKNQYQL